MQPIGKLLRNDVRKSMESVPPVKILTIEEQIKALEDSLVSNSDSEFSDIEDEVNVEVDQRDGLSIEKDAKGNVLRIVTNLSDDEFIAPLPTDKLPAAQYGKRINLAGKEIHNTTKRIRFSDEKTHPHDEVKQYKDTYVASSHAGKAFYCRTCKFEGENLEDFENHRSSVDHHKALEVEKKASSCQLCRKQFTSPIQLKEHLEGTSHKQRLELMKSRQGSRYRY